METKLSKLEGNLKSFKKEFIIAGPRTTTISFYKKLKELGAISISNPDIIAREKYLLRNKYKKFVILCVNEGINKKYAVIKVLSREWWDAYHNKRKIYSSHTYTTYNSTSQMDSIIKLLNIEPIEEIIPE